MENYRIIRSDNELYHFGVKGMKWGVRRANNDSASNRPARRSEEWYRQKSDKAAAKVKTSKTRIGKAISNERAYANELKANKKALLNANENEKNLLKRIDNTYGHGASAAQQKAAANFYDRKAGYMNSRLRKTMAEAEAFNRNSAAKANEKLHNSKSVKEYGKNYVDALANRKVKTWSGRTTTTGEQIIDELLFEGGGGLIRDIRYYRKGY